MKIYNYLSKVEKHYISVYNNADNEWDRVIRNTPSHTGNQNAEIYHLRMENENEKINNLVKNASLDDLRRSIEEDGEIVALKDPVFRDASNSHFIRSHFYAPRKYVLGKYFDTFWVNIIVIWSMSLLLWVTLYFDVLKKLLDFFSNNIKMPKDKKK